MNVSEKQKECHLVVRVKIPFKMNVNDKELDRFSRMYLRGFMKPNLVKKNLLEYKGPVGISLQKRLQTLISGRDLLLLLEQIIIAAQKIRANDMQLHYLIMNAQNVYINEVTKELQFIYFPVEGYTPTTSLVELVRMVVASAKVESERDVCMVAGLSRFLEMMVPFNVERLEEYIITVDKSVVDSLKKQNAGQSGFMTSKQQHYYEHYEEKQSRVENEISKVLDEEATGLLDEEAAGLYGYYEEHPSRVENELYREVDEEATGLLDEEATGLYGYYEKSPSRVENELYREVDEEATGLLYDGGWTTSREEKVAISPIRKADSWEETTPETTLLVVDEEEETTLLRPEEQPVEVPVYSRLHRMSTKEIIYLNKPVFRLGKEKSYVDYFVTNNPAVSRSHADIITRNNRHFIKDLNSKNRTFVNSRPIEVQTEVELYDGDRVRLGNEEFIFHK